MYEVSENYADFSADYARYIDCKIIVGDCTKTDTSRSWSDSRTYYSNDEIISVKITEGRTSGGFEIGLTYCKTLEATFRTSAEITANCRLKVFVRFRKGDAKTEWLPFGLFYADTISRSETIISVTAMDKMLQLEKNYKSKLSYPCKLSDMLTEILGYYSAETAEGFSFLYDATVSEKPIKDTDNDGNPVYYTRREILGYIASACGGNALFDKNGDFKVTNYDKITEPVANSSLISTQKDNGPVTINKVIWNTSGVTMARNDDVEAYETVEFENLLQIQSKEKLFALIESKIVGISYQPAVIKKQGFGYYELGDIISVPDGDNGTFAVMIGGISYSIDSSGFTETITSLALSDSQSNYRSNTAVSGNVSNSRPLDCTEKFTSFSANEDGTYTYNGITYGFEADEETGFINKIFDNEKTVDINTEFAEINSSAVDFNALVLAVAISNGLGYVENSEKTSVYEVEITADGGQIFLMNENGTIVLEHATIDWGDGSSEEYSTRSSYLHTYKKAGIYRISITADLTTLWGGFQARSNAVLKSVIRFANCVTMLGDLPNRAYDGDFEYIRLPKRVTELHDYIFNNGSKLKQIYGLENVTKIGIGCFCYYSLQGAEIVLPKCTSIGANAFVYTGIVKLDAPELTLIGGSALNSTNLKYLNAPKITSLNDCMVFCTTLEEAHLEGLITIDTPDLNNKTMTVHLSTALTFICQSAFYNSNVTIEYSGTQEQWDAIEKQEYWDTGATITLHCNG